ncbi:uncharacterized protein LOC117101693 [Anneissia japonica]|uniref:uncharacterized protein LOC117101693 n=1 Tax=Anneissia japonica TaxID=1529436 RepID=UPI0014259DD7|nr:uncharacterized protein LOC117101693 [Anneissia japonica]
MNVVDWLNKTSEKSFLSDYIKFKRIPKMESYLLTKTDFYGAQLKFKARSNSLQLEIKASKWDNNNPGTCLLCNNGIEDLRHFLFICNKLEEVRLSEHEILVNKLYDSGLSELCNQILTKDTDAFLILMLGGDCTEFIPNLPNHLIDLAHLIFDDFCKSYIKKAWAKRIEIKNGAML